MSSPKWITSGGIRYSVTWGHDDPTPAPEGNPTPPPKIQIPTQAPQDPDTYELYIIVPPKGPGDPWTFVKEDLSGKEDPQERQGACGKPKVE